MTATTITAAELRAGDNIRLSWDAGVRVHRVSRSGDTVSVWGQADPRLECDIERLLRTYAATAPVRLHGRDVPALTA